MRKAHFEKALKNTGDCGVEVPNGNSFLTSGVVVGGEGPRGRNVTASLNSGRIYLLRFRRLLADHVLEL